MKSFASSASSVVVRTICAASRAKSAAARSPAAGVVGADDLRQRAELLERVALGDPLRAEGDVDAAAALREVPARRTRWCPGRPCCAGRPACRRGGAGAICVDRLLEERHRRAQELVDRRPDDDDERVGAAERSPARPRGRGGRSGGPRRGARPRRSRGTASRRGRSARASPRSCRRSPTRSPARANARLSGRPTWPPPPRTTTSRSRGRGPIAREPRHLIHLRSQRQPLSAHLRRLNESLLVDRP